MQIVVTVNGDDDGGSGVWVIVAIVVAPIALGVLLRLWDVRCRRRRKQLARKAR